jgi:tripartite-type tricarboxylate transporter receptor subunit TctC
VATQNPEFAKALAAAGETAAPSASPAEYAARLDSERARWAPIAKRLNIDLS